jgi:hypothetical protein
MQILHQPLHFPLKVSLNLHLSTTFLSQLLYKHEEIIKKRIAALHHRAEHQIILQSNLAMPL